MWFVRDAKTDVPYTVVEAMTVPPENEAAFIDWDRRYNEEMRNVPGWLGSETLAPAPPEQAEWIVTSRWATKAEMLAFGDTDVYTRFETEGDALRSGSPTVRFFEGQAPTDQDPSRVVTSLLYWEVPPATAKQFAKWHEKYAQAMSATPGFQGYHLQEPVEGIETGRVRATQTDWVEVVRWDSPFARDTWVRSKERQRLLESGKDYFTTFRARNARTSFEGWFRFDDSNSRFTGSHLEAEHGGSAGSVSDRVPPDAACDESARVAVVGGFVPGERSQRLDHGLLPHPVL